MNKSLGLILTSIFLISTLGIIPGLVLTTQASPPPNPAAAIYTLPHVTTITYTTKSVNIFLNPYDNSNATFYLSAYYFNSVINATITATTISFKINNTTYSYHLSNRTAVAAYYDPKNVSVFFVLNLQGGYTTPYTINYTTVASFEMSANLPASNVYNYKNQSLGLTDHINALNLGYLLYQATNGKYHNISQLPAGSQIIISYSTISYTITLVKIQVLPAQLVNPLQQANVIPNPGYVQAVGRSNITIGVYDPYLSSSTPPLFSFNLTYASQTPAVINWFVLANTTYPSTAKVSSNFAAPIFGIYNTTNDSIFYKSISMPSILQFNGQMNVTAHENVTGTLQPGTYIYTSPNFNVTPPGNYTFSGRLNVFFKGYIFTNGSARVTAYIFNGSVSFFFPSVNEYAEFTFFMSPILPINTTANITSPQSVLVMVNSAKMFVAFPSLVVKFTIRASYTYSSSIGLYTIGARVTEVELNPSKVSFVHGKSYNYSDFISILTTASSSPLFQQTLGGSSNTTLTGTSLNFSVLMPLKFTVEKLGYIYLVIFKIWSPSTTVTVSGVDYYGNKISVGTFRSYIAPPTYYSTPKVPLSNITCDNRYTLVQVKDVGSVLYTVKNNENANNASVNGEWDLMTYPHVPSYLSAGLHIAVYNGTKLKYNTTIGILPNATTTPVTLTITLQGQTATIPYSTVPSAIYPVALKFAPSSGYSVTTNIITNTSVPQFYVVTVYMPLDYILNTKIVIWYVSPDFAAYYYYNTTGQFKTSNFTITFANITPILQMPQVFPVSKLYMPFGIIDPYYMFYNTISLGPVNGVIEFVENGYVVGNITSIKLQINGMNQTIVLSPANVSKLLITPNLGEVSECSPVFNAPQAFNITALATLLDLPSVSALNGSTLYITYHDRISGAYVTNKTMLTVKSFTIIPPTIPGSVEWILTAKYINATTGIPVEISYGVVHQPAATILDLNLVNSSSINYLQVINVKIASKYTTAEVMYNPSNASTIVYMNGKFVASYSGNLLPTIPEIAAGKFSGPVVNLYVAPGTLSSPNGTMYVVLGSHKVPIGTANLYTYAGYHFGPYTALPVVSNVTFTVEDPLIHTTLTGQTTLGAYNNTPIRIAPLGVSIPPSSSYKVFYYYTKPITLSLASQYIVITATSVIPYPYQFYIETVVFLGENVTTGTPVPGTPAFQTVEVVPALGPKVIVQVAVQLYQIISLSTPSSPHTVVMFAVPFAGGPAISEYPTYLVYTNVTAVSS